MNNNLDQILGGVNLTGVIQETTNGLPKVFPAGFYEGKETVDGDTGQYTIVRGVRQTAKLAAYGSPSQVRSLQGIGQKPVKLLHTVESISHKPATLTNLFAFNELSKQRLGIQEVTRQTRDFATLFVNGRNTALGSMLFNGFVCADSNGNFLNTTTGALVDVNYQVPSTNQGQGSYNSNPIISTSWSTASAKISTMLATLKKANARASGYPLKYAFYGENVPDMIFGSNYYAQFIKFNPQANTQALQGEIPDGFGGFTWIPAYQAFFKDQNNNTQDLMNPNGVTFTPEPDPTWIGWLEGTYPVPTTVGQVVGDMAQAMGSFQIVSGQFSYAQVTTDPPAVKQVAGDTYLPVLKVPAAVWQFIVGGF